MRLLVKHKPMLKEFVRKEFEGKIVEELSESFMIVESDYKDILLNSRFIEQVSIYVGYVDSIHSLSSFEFDNYISKDESFRIRCRNREVCVVLGQIVKDKTKASVSLENPDKVVVVESLDSKYLVYIPLSESKLSHRGYSVSNKDYVEADICSALVDYSSWKDNGVLLDPFCHQGYVIIEAVLREKGIGVGVFKRNEFDFDVEVPKDKKLSSKVICMSNDMNDLKLAKQNARGAYVFKDIKFMFSTLNDLDYVMKEATVDYVVTCLPKDIDYDKLFFQLEYIVKKGGTIVLLSPKEIEEEYVDYEISLVEQKEFGRWFLCKMVRE